MHSVNHGENIVEVQNVSFSYNGSEVLKDIDLTIHRGDYLGLVGGNGSGKTTLIKIILGLLNPATGKVVLFGRDIGQFREWHKIGYVPQKAANFDLNFPATVGEVTLMGRFGRRKLFHKITGEDKAAAHEALKQVDMYEHRDRLIGELSGGQQQRILIARALAGQPEILFLDEPTVGVEQNIRNEFYALLKKLNQDLNLTVVLVTHDIEAIMHDAMHVVCIDKTILFHNSVKELLKNTQLVTHPHH